MKPNVKIYSERVFDFIRRDFGIEVLGSDFQFTEGPVWNEGGFYLFSDIPANCIYKISETGSREVYLSNSGTDHPVDPELSQQPGSNALAYDRDGSLLVCQHGGDGIARYDGKELKPFIHSFQNRPFNSPNDLIIHSDGSIYFSDPPYGLKDSKPNPAKFQPLAGVYCWREDTLELICDKYQYPNGVCLSNDQKTLYICSNKPFERFISAYDTGTHRFLGVFAEETSDGIEIDRFGNIYLCSKEGLIILDRDGHRLALIELPTIPANICWGGGGGDLFVTAREYVYLIRELMSPVPH